MLILFVFVEERWRRTVVNLRQSSSFSSRLLSTTRPTVLACLCGEWGIRAGSRNIYTCGKIPAFDLHEFQQVVKNQAQLTVSADESHPKARWRKLASCENHYCYKCPVMWLQQGRSPLPLWCAHPCVCHFQSPSESCPPSAGRTTI